LLQKNTAIAIFYGLKSTCCQTMYLDHMVTATNRPKL